MVETRKCSKCGCDKALDYFSLNVKNEYFKTCNQCREKGRITRAHYMQQPKYQQYQKAYNRRPEVMAKNRQRLNQPEALAYARDWKREHSKEKLTYIAKAKVSYCKKADRDSNREYDDDDYVTVEWIVNELAKCENKCFHCKKTMKITNFEPFDQDQFTVDRIYNDMAHEPENCVISCLACNCAHNDVDIF